MSNNDQLLHLDWGFIDESYDPEIINKLLRIALKKRRYKILQYNDGHGLADLRQSAARFLKDAFKINNINYENICVTNGVTAGLDLVARFLLHKQYDSVCFEPVYDTAINCLKINSRKVHGVEINPFSPDKTIPQSSWNRLELILSSPNTKLLYLVPNFQNPTGKTINYQDRIKIYKLCQQNNVYVVEDDPYKLYNFTSDALPENFINLNAAKNNVIYLNSISKLFFPGIRIGFVVANEKIIDGISELQKYTTSSANLLMQGVVHEALISNIMKASFKHYYSIINNKRALILSEIEKQSLNQVIDYDVPCGGFYIWCRMKNRLIDTKPKLIEAKLKKILYVPGVIYFVNADRTNYLRLAYSQIPLNDIKEAIKRLKNTLK